MPIGRSLGVAAILCAAAFSSISAAAELGAREVTFSKDVAPILQEKCQSCHREGQMAPMSLVTYEQARPWAKAIKTRVMARQMPPWHLDKTVGIQSFQNDMSLSDVQIATIARWVDEGAPQGNPNDMPAAKQWPKDDGWQLAAKFGPPDIILKSDDFTMPAKGQDAWYKPLTPIPLTEPRWVRAVEMRPGTPAGRKITHHALAYLQQEEPGSNTGPQTQGLLMEWAVNKNYDIYRPDTGKLLQPGARIWWEMHYHAVGEEIRDHIELAVYLYPKGQEPKYRTRLVAFSVIPNAARGLDISPNSIATTSAVHVLKAPARLENFQPHMHLRGKAMMMEAILPDGTYQVLSYANNFNWMNNYIYTEDAAPVLPKGTVLRFTAWYDNTSANPNNPDPNQWVGFGDRTVDEMSHAWVNVTYITQEDYDKWAASHKPKQAANARAGQPAQ